MLGFDGQIYWILIMVSVTVLNLLLCVFSEKNCKGFPVWLTGSQRINFITIFVVCCILPSVLWRCWLGGRKGIRPVKNRSGVVLVWLSVWSKVQTCIWPSWCHCHSLSLASVKSRLVLPFSYQLTWVVPEKGPLNGCVCVCVFCCMKNNNNNNNNNHFMAIVQVSLC